MSAFEFESAFEWLCAAWSGARNVLLDVEGPGCIRRIFVVMVGKVQAKTRIQCSPDHNDTAVIDMPATEFFDDENGPVPYRLVLHKSYPGTFFPIPFGKHFSYYCRRIIY